MIPVWLIIVLVVIAIIVIICALAWYRIVPPSEAHLVVTRRGKLVVSPDGNVSRIYGNVKKNKTTYFNIPSFLPIIARTVRILSLIHI